MPATGFVWFFVMGGLWENKKNNAIQLLRYLRNFLLGYLGLEGEYCPALDEENRHDYSHDND